MIKDDMINNDGVNSMEINSVLDPIYNSLFTNNHSIMLLIDPDNGDIIDANSAACSFYGYSYHDILNKRINQINTLTQEELFNEMQAAKNEKDRREQDERDREHVRVFGKSLLGDLSKWWKPPDLP